ncbi:MAG: heavy metal translocating P-type ATPase, partial [Phycisphaerales bacterium JB040]
MSPSTDHNTPRSALARAWEWKEIAIAFLAIASIATYLVLRYATDLGPHAANWALWVALALGGAPLVLDLLVKALRREFGSDLLAGISIVTSVLLDEYLAGVLVVLMLSGGEALEAYAVSSASGVLKALAKRVPSVAHVRRDGRVADVPIDEVAVGDQV